MKFKAFLIAAAALACFASCQKAATTTEDLGDPRIYLSTESLNFTQDAGEQTITVTSSRAWKVQGLADWVSVTPASGEASAKAQSVTVAVLANTEMDRNVTLTFTCGIEKAYLRVSQAGPGGVDDGISTVAEVIDEGDEEKLYTLKGTVSRFNATYCSFDLTDETGTIYVYSVTATTKEEYAGLLANGDVVTIEGNYTFYESKSQHEIVNAEIVEWTQGQKPEATDVTLAEFLDAEEGGYYRISGTITDRINTTYGNFNISDGTNTVYVYGATNHANWTEKIAAGNVATLVGEKYNYEKDGNVTIELINATIEDITGDNGGGDDPISGGDGEEMEGENLLADYNPGFETWDGESLDACWQFTSGSATVKKSADAHSGSYAAEVCGATSNKRLMSQEYCLKAGTYQIKVWCKGSGYIRLGYAKLTNHIVADTSNDYVYLSDARQCSGEWTKIWDEFTLSQDTNVSFIILNNKKSSGESIFVDDVEIVTEGGALSLPEGGGDDPGLTVPFEQMDASNVKEGKYVISYINNNSTWVMKAEVKSSYYVTAEEFDLTGGNIPSDECVFTVAKSGDGYTIKTYEGKYMGITISGTHYNLVPNLSDPYVWSFAAVDGGIVATGANSDSYFLSYNTGYTEFTTSTNQKYAPQYYYVGE